MSELTTTADLNKLASKIKKAFRNASEYGRKTVETYIEIGTHLTEAKAAMDHGQWYGWLDDNFELTERTALNYMRLAERAEEIRNAFPILGEASLRKALALIAKPKEETSEEDSSQEESSQEGSSQEESSEGPPPADDVVDGEVLPPGRSPEQVAEDVARDAIYGVLQQCHWKQVDHLLAFQTLIKLLAEEVNKTVIPLSAEESAEARKAAHAAADAQAALQEQESGAEEQEAPAKKGPAKRGRPQGSKNKPKSEAASTGNGDADEPTPEPAATVASEETVSPPTSPDGGLDIPAYLDRRNEASP